MQQCELKWRRLLVNQVIKVITVIKHYTNFHRQQRSRPSQVLSALQRLPLAARRVPSRNFREACRTNAQQQSHTMHGTNASQALTITATASSRLLQAPPPPPTNSPIPPINTSSANSFPKTLSSFLHPKNPTTTHQPNTISNTTNTSTTSTTTTTLCATGTQLNWIGQLFPWRHLTGPITTITTTFLCPKSSNSPSRQD